MTTLAEVLKAGPTSTFEKCADGALFYVTSANFRFRVPVVELGASMVGPVERTSMFMRWIKRELAADVAVEAEPLKIKVMP